MNTVDSRYSTGLYNTTLNTVCQKLLQIIGQHFSKHKSFLLHSLVRIDSQLQWRHNGRDSVSNHQPRDCLLNRLIGRRSRKTSKLRVTGLLCGTGEFPAQMASNAENVSIWWRHHESKCLVVAYVGFYFQLIFYNLTPFENHAVHSVNYVHSWCLFYFLLWFCLDWFIRVLQENFTGNGATMPRKLIVALVQCKISVAFGIGLIEQVIDRSMEEYYDWSRRRSH